MTNKVVFLSILIILIFKFVAIGFTELNLYGDEAQYWLWSKSLDLGYYSKPPLLAWFLSGHTMLFGNSFFSLKLFPIFIYLFIFLSIYKLCLQLSFSKEGSLFCALSFIVIPATTVSSFLISTDLLLLLFWTMLMTKLLNLRKSGSNLDFLLLGLFLGLAFLAKYAAIYFVLSFLCLLIFDKKIFLVCKNNPFGVLVFLLSFIIVLAPNIFWNFKNSWVTVSHTSSNANLQNLNLNFYQPMVFLISQIFMLGPILVLSFLFLYKKFKFEFENNFLLIFSIPVIVIVLIESFLVRANANWAAPALISVFILMFRLVYNKKITLLKINFILNFLTVLLFFGAIMISSKNSIFDRITGINNFSTQVLNIVGRDDLAISDRIVFSNISYELRNEPNNIYMVYRSGSPISNQFQITSNLSQKKKRDFYLIGDPDDISYLEKKYESKFLKEFVVPFSTSNLKLYEINFK